MRSPWPGLAFLLLGAALTRLGPVDGLDWDIEGGLMYAAEMTSIGQQLKAEYGANSSIPYRIMNKLGAMRGNKITAKGRAMERKHAATLGDLARAK